MVREAFEGGQLTFLKESDVEKIHETSLRILEEVGIKVGLEEAREIYRRGGAEVGSDPSILKIAPRMVEGALKTIPRKILLCGREESNDLVLEGRKVCAGTGGAELNVLDLESQKLRRATLRDIADIARLVDGLEHIDFFIRPVETDEVPPEKMDINKYYYSLANTSKHVMGNVHYRDKVKEVIEMAGMISGDEERLKARPIVSFITSWMLGSLTLNPEVTGILIEIVNRQMPVVLSSVAILGLTSPVTMAGNLALAHAEQLSGIVLTQLVRPGAPVIYGGCPGVIDMRKGTFSPGSIERQILNASITQMAHFVGLPNYNIGGITDSKVPDVQAGYEKGFGIGLTALAGSNYIHHAAGRIRDGVAYEQYVIDNEIIGMAKRALRGVRVNEETLAFEEVRELGHGGNFITHPHTLRFFKKEVFPPVLSDRNDRKIWEDLGCLDGRERARNEAKRILKEHHPLQIHEATDARIRDRFAILSIDRRG